MKSIKLFLSEVILLKLDARFHRILVVTNLPFIVDVRLTLGGATPRSHPIEPLFITKMRILIFFEKKCFLTLSRHKQSSKTNKFVNRRVNCLCHCLLQ